MIDDERTTRRLLDEIKRLKRTSLTRSIGVVTETSPLTVTIAGVPHTDLMVLTSYTPVAEDRVFISRVGNDLLIHGAIG